MSKNKVIKMKKTLISFFGGLGIIAWIFYLSWNELILALKRAELCFIFTAFLLYILVILLWAIRWKVYIEKNTSIKELLPIIFAGIAVNAVTPLARAGGEPVRAYLLKLRKKLTFSESMASALSELVAEFLSQLVIVILSFPIVLLLFHLPLWMILAYGFFVFLYSAIGMGIISIQDEMKINKFFTWLSFKSKKFSVMRARIAKRFFAFQIKFKKSIENKRKLAITLFLSLFSKFLEALKLVFIFYSLGKPISILTAFVIIALALVLSSIPSTPGSLGILEGGIVSFLIFIGIPSGVAVGVVLIDRVITFWIPLLIGTLILYHYGISLKIAETLEKGARK